MPVFYSIRSSTLDAADVQKSANFVTFVSGISQSHLETAPERSNAKNAILVNVVVH